jgi:GxxExxY protein
MALRASLVKGFFRQGLGSGKVDKYNRRGRREGAEDAEVGENDVGRRILECAVEVHQALGPGLLESVYETCLAHELGKAGMTFDRQRTLPVIYDGLLIDPGYRLDLLVESLVVVEIKAVDQVNDVHRAQLLSYLKLGRYRLGYVLNFNVARMRDGITRMANGL